MNTKEKKFIDLKVLLSVQDISELSANSRLFKRHGVSVGFKESEAEINIATPFAREISWLFYQLKYIFGDNKAFIQRVARNAKIAIDEGTKLKDLVDIVLESTIEK